MATMNDWDAFLNMSWDDYQLESDPSMAYFSSGAFAPGQGMGPAQQQYWQGQAGNIWNQYQGVLGTELRQGAETPTTFVDFLAQQGDELKSEFLIPSVINDLIRSGKESVHVLYSNAPWFGVTYKEDKPYVVDQIHKLINDDFYPRKLFG